MAGEEGAVAKEPCLCTIPGGGKVGGSQTAVGERGAGGARLGGGMAVFTLGNRTAPPMVESEVEEETNPSSV